MSRFLERMFGREPKETSATMAKSRLQFVLVHDRINLEPEQMEAMKAEILAVISKYVSVDSDRVDIALQQRDRNNNMLVAEIPFSKTRTPPVQKNETEAETEPEDSDKTQPKDDA